MSVNLFRLSEPLDTNVLIEIPRSDWQKLSSLYSKNWPKYVVTHYTIENYISWVAQNPAMEDVRIVTTDEHWQSHGTFLLEDRNILRYNIMMDSFKPELLFKALQTLPKSVAYTLTAYAENVREVVEQHLMSLGLQHSGPSLCATVVYYLPKSESKQLKLPKISDYEFKPLEEKYTEHIDDMWPHKYPGSDYKIRRIIRYNETIGAFSAETGDLCAWAFIMQVGTIGLLHVDNKHRRKGLASYLVIHLCKVLADMDMDATAHIMNENEPSRSLFEKLNFREIDRGYWYDKPLLRR